MSFEQIVDLVNKLAMVIFTGALVWATIALVRATERLNNTTKRYADITDKIKTLHEQVKTLQTLIFVEPILRLLSGGHGEQKTQIAAKLSQIFEKNGFGRNAEDEIEHSRRVLWEIFSDSFGEALGKRKSDQNTEKKSE